MYTTKSLDSNLSKLHKALTSYRLYTNIPSLEGVVIQEYHDWRNNTGGEKFFKKIDTTEAYTRALETPRS